MQTKELTFNEIIDASSSQPEKNIKFEVPKFQRRRVWKPDQEDELIDTLKIGNISIGVIQLWKIGIVDKKEKYLLVDGLHRISTICKYYENPFSFGRSKRLINEIILSMNEKYGKTYAPDVINKCCSEWLNKDVLGNYQEFVEDKLFNDEIDKLKDIVGSHIVDKKGKEEFYKTLLEKTRSLVKNISITDSKIPAILNTGEYKDLTMLFKRINQNGTPLSLNDVLAAIWSNTPVKIKNKEIITCIMENYAEMKQENNNMDIYEDGNKTFNASEYVTGLKRWLGKKFSGTFFGYIKDKEFVLKILSCCEFEDITKKSIQKLDSVLVEMDLSNLEKYLVWSIEYISSVFDKILIKEGKLLITEVPIYVSLITLAYKNRSIIKKNKEKYSMLFVLNMLNDKVSGVSYNARTIDSVVKQKKFMYKIHKGEFIEKLTNYSSDTIKLFGKYDKLTPLTKLILSIILSTLKFDEDNDDDDDKKKDLRFANIIAKKVVMDYNKDKKSRLSINNLGNICLFPVGDNNRKPTQSIYNYLTVEKRSVNYIDKNIIFLGGEDKFDELLAKAEEFGKKEYIEFLKLRCTNIKNLLVNYFKDYLKADDDEEEEEDNLDTETGNDEDDKKSNKSNKSDKSDSESDSSDDSDNSNNSDSEPEIKKEIKPVKKVIKYDDTDNESNDESNKSKNFNKNNSNNSNKSNKSNKSNESDSVSSSDESDESDNSNNSNDSDNSDNSDSSDDSKKSNNKNNTSKKPKKVEKRRVGNGVSIKIKSK